MFLRSKTRIKDGKKHSYWSVVENRRVSGGKTIQRQVLYLGEIGSGQQAQWNRALEAFDESTGRMTQIALFPEDRAVPEMPHEAVHVRLKDFELCRPRQWGACWLALDLWEQLQLDAFWQGRLPESRKGTSWLNVLKTLACYRLIDPGSEWRLHRQWWDTSAMGDLLGEDAGLAESHKLYRCLDKLLEHKEALFTYLKERWKTLFNPRFDVLLYDLTSTYFECDPPVEGKRKHGYSRDRRPDCVQVVIALIVTPEGFPLAYEVLAGNTSDKTTLGDFLAKIEAQYGKANRIWVMDRGIPTEETLAKMRASSPPVSYLVGTPKGRLTALEKDFLGKPWSQAKEAVSVKLLERDGEVYILAKSEGRVLKERGIRRRKLKKFWARLQELRRQALSRDQLLLKLGAAQKEAGRAAALVTVKLPKAGQPVTPETFTFTLNRPRLRACRRHEGRYLLRSNLVGQAPAELWAFYIQLTEVEQAFKELKGDLAIRPVYHQTDVRIEAHIFVSFLAYCLQVTLKQRLHALAPGLTPRAVLEKFAAVQMLDVHFPATDGRTLIFTRYTQPEKDQQLLLQQLRLRLPPQPPPRIARPKTAQPAGCGADL
jgi:hypothetical protein